MLLYQYLGSLSCVSWQEICLVYLLPHIQVNWHFTYEIQNTNTQTAGVHVNNAIWYFKMKPKATFLTQQIQSQASHL